MTQTRATYTPGPWEAFSAVGAGWSVRRQYDRPGYRGLAPICSMMPQELEAAAQQLARSERGRNALRGVLDLLEQRGALGLDPDNRYAVLTLLEGAWGGYASTARDAIRDALEATAL